MRRVREYIGNKEHTSIRAGAYTQTEKKQDMTGTHGLRRTRQVSIGPRIKNKTVEHGLRRAKLEVRTDKDKNMTQTTKNETVQ